MDKAYESDTPFDSQPSDSEETMEVDLDAEENIKNIDLFAIEQKLDARKSANTTDVLDFCDAEHTLIEKIHTLVFERLDDLDLDDVTPKPLSEPATDFWLHVLELIADHVDDIECKAPKQ